MRSSVIPPSVISATCLSLLSACNNFSPTLRQNPPDSKITSAHCFSMSSLRETLGKSFELVQANYTKLKEGPLGSKLGSAYLKVLELNPKPAVAFSLNSFLNSEIFQKSTSEDQLALMEVLASGLTEKRAARFVQCFHSQESFLDSRDLTGQALLVSLHALATGPIIEGLESERGAMVTALWAYGCGLFPLDQGNTNGCGAVACLLALDNRAEIVRLVQGLSSPAGSVRLASGAIMHRCNSSLRDNGDKEQGTALRILAASVLNHGNGSLFNFSSRWDLNHCGPIILPGMLSNWTLQAINDLSGVPHTLLKGKDASLKTMGEALKNGKYVLILRKATLTDWHWIVLRRIQGEFAYFQDPNGCPFALEQEEHVQKKKTESFKQNKAPGKSRSEINFPEESYGDPLLGINRVPISALEECTKVIIVPTAALQVQN